MTTTGAYDRISATVTIDDDEILDAAIGDIRLTETIVHRIPTLQLSLFSTERRYETPISDGSKVRLELDFLRDNHPIQELSFRVFRNQILYRDRGYDQMLTCYLDLEDYFGIQTESIEGTSSAVFNTFAQRNNLRSDIDTTNDLQVWIRNNVRGLTFLTRVAQYAYMDDTSYMDWVISRDGVLRFKNLTEQKTQTGVWNFARFQELDQADPANLVRFDQFTLEHNTGLSNVLFGYGRDSRYRDFLNCEEKSVQITRNRSDMRVLPLNLDLKKNQRLVQLPHFAGNTHRNYQKALVQNQRLKALFSIRARILLSRPRNFQLLDPVDLSIYSNEAANEKSETYSGTFLISAIETEIQGTFCQQRVVLMKDGLNATQTLSNLAS